MSETIKDVEFYTVSNVEEPSEMVIKSQDEQLKDELMKKILGESVAVSVGNYIFIPPLANPEVTALDRTMMVMNQSNFLEGYVKIPIKLDDNDMFILTHISRIVHEGPPVSVTIHSVDHFSENDLCIAFKNEFPGLFIDTVRLLIDHKKYIE